MKRPKPETLAEMLFYLSDPAKRKQLEEYRIEFEARFGPTDLTLRYTSTWPEEEQDWLIEHDTQRFFDGLPPFAKAFLKGKVEIALRKGNGDSMPDNFLRLYIAGGMKLDLEVRGH
jgi:hypothetical protein